MADCGSVSDEIYVHGTICDNSKIFNITREQEEAGVDIKDDQGNIVCKSPGDNWAIISRDDPRFCDGVPDCNSESDELCPYITFRVESKIAKIPRNNWVTETDSEDDQGNIVCKSHEREMVDNQQR